MQRILLVLGLLLTFSAGAVSVLLVDIARNSINTALTPETNVAPKVTPVIPEDSKWEAPKEAPSDNFFNSGEAPQAIYPENQSDLFALAVERAAPAVVNIFSSRVVQRQDSLSSPFFDNPFFEDFFSQPPQPRERVQRSLGSGVILSSGGYIVTNYHVVAEATDIIVALHDGREAPATLVGADPETDIALLSINLGGLPVIDIGDINNVRVGDLVLAIGNPYGVGQTVTQGIISATGRSGIGITTFENFLQTDAAINPGNSGGALINTNGELWGINTAIFSRSGGSAGVGFAIPVDLVQQIVDQIRNEGSVSRGWMGVSLRDGTVEGQNNGVKRVIINGVYRDSPADLAGVTAGDEILTLDGRDFDNTAAVVNYVANKQPGEQILISVQRGENIIDLSLTLGTRPLNR